MAWEDNFVLLSQSGERNVFPIHVGSVCEGPSAQVRMSSFVPGRDGAFAHASYVDREDISLS